MRRIFLCFILMHLALVKCFSQSESDSVYHTRELKLEEVNLVSAYYVQDGNNSAVTGGVGTEYLTDFANTIDIRLSRYGRKNRLHTFSFDMGVDAYTSASSDKIDPNTVSSASSADQRIYPSLTWGVSDEATHKSWGVTGSWSTEYDYESFGAGLFFSKGSKDGNRDLTLKAAGFLDTWKIILPVELRTASDPESAPRNSINMSATLSQVLTRRLQAAVMLEPAWQEGLLATRYQRVYFNDGSVKVEELPDTRWKIAASLRASYFLGDRFIVRSFYRFYTDQWNLLAHTFNVEVPVKIMPLLSVSPFYRYYIQDGIPWFAPYKQHNPSERYYTSDYDLSTLTSQAAGAGLRLTPRSGILGIPWWNTVEVRFEHYMRSTGLTSDIATIALKFKPDLTFADLRGKGAHHGSASRDF